MIISKTSKITTLRSRRTHSLVSLGFQSRKMRLKARTKPPHRIKRPRTIRTKLPIGVRLPKALLRRNRGNASCSSALKTKIFCGWKRSGIKGDASPSKGEGNSWMRSDGLSPISWLTRVKSRE